MRIDIIEWKCPGGSDDQKAFQAAAIATYLTAEEVNDCALHAYVEAAGADMFLLRFDARRVRDDATKPLRLLAQAIQADIRRQEEARRCLAADLPARLQPTPCRSDAM